MQKQVKFIWFDNPIVTRATQPGSGETRLRTGLPIDCTNEWGKEIFSQYGAVAGTALVVVSRASGAGFFWQIVGVMECVGKLPEQGMDGNGRSRSQ